MEIIAENLTMKYLDGIGERTILNKINMVVDERKPNILVGPSGSGKSTLLYLLSTLRKPSGGIVKFENEIISNSQNSEAIRFQRFGFVFQQPFLIPYLTSMENICMARKDLDLRTEAEKLLGDLGLKELSNRMPYQLSGGQRQRIALARALVKKPDVIFADEPTAALDKENSKQVYKLLKESTKGKILIIATHDTDLFEGDERIFKIENEQVEEV